MFTSQHCFIIDNLEVTLTEDYNNRIKLQRPVESEINFFHSSPKLQFQNLDSVLKTQLYNKSFPVIRRTLWLASRRTAKLGKKPVTYLFSTAIVKDVKSKENVQNFLASFFVNKVFYVYYLVNCFYVKNLDTTKIQRFCVFANTDVLLMQSDFTAENLKLFVNPRIDVLFIHEMNIEFNSVVKFRKYLGSLFYYDPLPNDWESILFNSETQFGNLRLSRAKIVDYESMRNFVNRQLPDFDWRVNENIINNQGFFKYFKQCDIENHGHDVPHLSHNSATSGKTIHFCSNTETPNEPTIVAE